MYLVSSGFSFKPTSSSSSSTQFSQEWARRKVVVKHSIKSNSYNMAQFSLNNVHKRPKTPSFHFLHTIYSGGGGGGVLRISCYYTCPSYNILSPKGAKVYPASRRRSCKRVGLKGRLAPHCVPWLKNSIMAYKRLSTSLGSKTLNNTSLGLGGNQNLRPSCRRPPARTFHIPVGTLRFDVPELVWVHSPNDGNKLGWR